MPQEHAQAVRPRRGYSAHLHKTCALEQRHGEQMGAQPERRVLKVGRPASVGADTPACDCRAMVGADGVEEQDGEVC